MSRLFAAACCLIALIGCGKKVGSIPSFVVKPLKETPIRAIQAGPISILGADDTDDTENMCDKELAHYNDAPSLDGGPEIPGKDYVDYFYSQALSEDCHLRMQVMDLSERYLKTEGDLKTIKDIDEDLSDPKDDTRFVSWTGDATSDNAKGKLVYLYLNPENQIRNETHMAFEKIDGVKKSIVTHISSGGSLERDEWIRSFFQEIVDDSGDVVGHYVGGRKYDDKNRYVTIVLSHVLKGKGASVFRYQCYADDSGDEAFNLPCEDNLTKVFWKKGQGGVSDTSSDQASYVSGLGLVTDVADLSGDSTGDIGDLSYLYRGKKYDFFKPEYDPSENLF